MTDLTKQEINLRIAKLVFPDCGVIKNFMVTGQTSCDIVMAKHGTYRAVPDYCNNPNDLMPLVWEHEIGIDYFKEGLSAMATVEPDIVIHEVNKDPQMALALCLLKVLEAKEKDDEK